MLILIGTLQFNNVGGNRNASQESVEVDDKSFLGVFFLGRLISFIRSIRKIEFCNEFGKLLLVSVIESDLSLIASDLGIERAY